MFSTKKATKSSTYLLTDLTLIQFERPIRVLNSRIRIHNMENEGRILGEVRQVWAPLRRKYELSVLYTPLVYGFKLMLDEEIHFVNSRL